MSVSTISSFAGGNTDSLRTDNANTQRQLQKNIGDVGKALESGDLGSARNALTALQKNVIGGEHNKTQLRDAVKAIDQSLKAGDVKGAKEALAGLQQDDRKPPKELRFQNTLEVRVVDQAQILRHEKAQEVQISQKSPNILQATKAKDEQELKTEKHQKIQVDANLTTGKVSRVERPEKSERILPDAGPKAATTESRHTANAVSSVAAVKVGLGARIDVKA